MKIPKYFLVRLTVDRIDVNTSFRFYTGKVYIAQVTKDGYKIFSPSYHASIELQEPSCFKVNDEDYKKEIESDLHPLYAYVGDSTYTIVYKPVGCTHKANTGSHISLLQENCGKGIPCIDMRSAKTVRGMMDGCKEEYKEDYYTRPSLEEFIKIAQENGGKVYELTRDNIRQHFGV